MRGKPAKKRKIEPDYKFSSEMISKFINLVMMHGKKNVAQSIVYNAIEIAGSKEKNKEAIEVFDAAIENLKPKLEIRSRRVGGANYSVPVPVNDQRQIALAFRWLISAARDRRKNKKFENALAEELVDAFHKTGNAFKKKEDTHKMAEANKAFAHFQW